MTLSKLPNHNKTPSPELISMIWQFLRKDIHNEFEQWVYQSNELEEMLDEASYFTLISANYQNKYDTIKLRTLCLDFVSKFPLTCICPTFLSNMILDPFNEEDGTQLRAHLESFTTKLKIKDFTGSPSPNTRSWPHPAKQHLCETWFHPAKLQQCPTCMQHYLMFFEEDLSDYYVIRITTEDAATIHNHPAWPNTSWPKKLSNWKGFLHIKFIRWHDLYSTPHKKLNPNINFMQNYTYIKPYA